MTSIPRRGSSLCLTQSLVGKSSALAREIRKKWYLARKTHRRNRERIIGYKGQAEI